MLPCVTDSLPGCPVAALLLLLSCCCSLVKRALYSLQSKLCALLAETATADVVIRLRAKPGELSPSELRVAIIGNVDSGKSTMVSCSFNISNTNSIQTTRCLGQPFPCSIYYCKWSQVIEQSCSVHVCQNISVSLHILHLADCCNS